MSHMALVHYPMLQPGIRLSIPSIILNTIVALTATALRNNRQVIFKIVIKLG